MGRKSRKWKAEKIKVKSRFNLRIILFLVFSVVVGFIGILVIVSYTGFGSPPVPRSLVRVVDIVIASSPLLPKNPNQILAKSLFETSRISSGEHKFSLNLTQKGGGEKEINLFSLGITGPFTKSSNQIDLAGEATIIYPGIEGYSKIKFAEKDDFVYFYLEDTPNSFGLDFSKLQGSWYKLDITKILSDAKASTRSDEEVEKTITEKTKMIIEVIESENLMESINVLSDEVINDRNNYHFQIKFNQEQTKRLVETLSEGSDQIPDIKSISFDLWVDKSSFFLNKLSLTGIISSESKRSGDDVLVNLPDLNFNVTYELLKPNLEVAIDTPESSKDLGSLLDLYLLVKADEEIDPASTILGAVSNIGEFGANFLTIERLVHVLYLAPQSF